MKFREIVLGEGNKIILGKDAEQNEELVTKYKGKENVILHTAKPGSPFGIIEKTKPTKDDIKLGASVVARYSQDWRDNKSDVNIHLFTGKNVYKRKGMDIGTFGVKKFKVLKVNKKDIEKW